MRDSRKLFSRKVAVALMAVAGFSVAHANPVEPLGFVGSFCSSGGNYDADTQDLSLTWTDGGCGVRVGPFNESLIGLFDVDQSSMTVNAQIDNEGNPLGGEFAWFGAIPELGITSVSLLASGEVTGIDVLFYPDLDIVEAILVQVDFTTFAPEMTNFGLVDLGLGPFGVAHMTALSAWAGGVAPWSVSENFISPTLNELYTYQSRPRLVVPEPGTMALLALGIVGMGLARRRPI